MTIETILKICYSVAGFLSAAIPLVIGLIVVIKQKINTAKQIIAANDEKAKAEAKAADAEATTAMYSYANELVEAAEVLYKDVNISLKEQGKSAGPVKKDSVMSKLQMFALEHNYTFDFDKWSDTVDQIVKLTKNVNAK